MNSVMSFTTNDDVGDTILVTLEDSVIADHEISITESVVGDERHEEQHAMRDVLLVTTVNEAHNHLPKRSGRNSTDDNKEHISQNWFTSKTDKQSLQEQGHKWRQGQWTSEENDLLRHNIAFYCEEKGIDDPTSVIFVMTKDMRKDFYRYISRGLDRPLFSVYRRVLRMYDEKNHVGKYTSDEIMKLRVLRETHGNDWATIGAALGRSAGSVRDRCRLMKDSCRYGTWQHDEEMRLAVAVYELSGAQPGEEVHHGLSWADVASKVKTRTDKQCRAKWLNFLNWKQKGGTEWAGPTDDYILLQKIIASGATDETEVDWVELSKGWSCVRSPQWLRSKWWALKRHVTNYQNLPLSNILSTLSTLTSAGTRLRPAAAGSEPSPIAASGSILCSKNDSKLSATGTTTFRLCNSAEGYRLTPTIQLPDGTRAVLSDDISLESASVFLTPSNTNTFLISNSNDTISFPLSSMSEPLIVQTLPLGESSVKDETSVSLSDDHTRGASDEHSDDDIVYCMGDVTEAETAHVADTILVSNCVTQSAKSPLHHLSSTSDPLLNSRSTDDLTTDS